MKELQEVVTSQCPQECVFTVGFTIPPEQKWSLRIGMELEWQALDYNQLKTLGAEP